MNHVLSGTVACVKVPICTLALNMSSVYCFKLKCLSLCFCGRVPWLYQYWPGGVMLFVVLCPGTPESSAGSGSGFKASQKTGQRLKVSSDRLGEADNRTS